MIYLKLFYEFMLVGVFTFGGGMASLPLLTDLGVRTGWFGSSFVTEMIAVSQSTPGPIGINMATYVGYEVGGVFGGIIASIGFAFLPTIISMLVATALTKFSSNKYVKSAFCGLRPVVLALIIFAGYTIFAEAVLPKFDLSYILSLTNIVRAALFGILLFGIRKFKIHPVIYIVIAAIIGIVFKL